MNEWRYIIQKAAVRYLKRLPQKDQKRDALDALVENPRNADLKSLRGRSGSRLRVGSYRVLMLVDNNEKLFVVTEIGPRGDGYK